MLTFELACDLLTNIVHERRKSRHQEYWGGGVGFELQGVWWGYLIDKVLYYSRFPIIVCEDQLGFFWHLEYNVGRW